MEWNGNQRACSLLFPKLSVLSFLKSDRYTEPAGMEHMVLKGSVAIQCKQCQSAHSQSSNASVRTGGEHSYCNLNSWIKTGHTHM